MSKLIYRMRLTCYSPAGGTERQLEADVREESSGNMSVYVYCEDSYEQELLEHDDYNLALERAFELMNNKKLELYS